MRKAMEKWLNQRQITFDPNTANSICDKFGLDGEKADECLGLCYQLEANKITQAEFTGGLCVLTGKEPEDVMGILKGVKGTRPKMTLDELDKKAIALFIKRHGREAYESGEIGEMLERIEQRAEEYDPVFLSKHPELKGKSITVYHDPLAGEDWAVVNNETGEVVEVFSEELLMGVKPVSDHKIVAVIGDKGDVAKGLIKAIADKELAIACYNALANHGIAVHYTILGKMVRRYYKPEITDQQVLSCLSRNKDLFRKLEDYPGAYFLAGKKEGQTYPEMEAIKELGK